MSCNSATLSSINCRCDNTRGGVKGVWLFDAADVSTYTVTNGKVTALTIDGSVYAYQMKDEVASFTSTGTFDKTNGIKTYDNVLSMTFNKMDSAKRTAITALADSEVAAMVKDANGKYWISGLEELDTPFSVTANTAETGTAVADGNKYTLEMTSQTPDLPLEVDASVAVAFIS